MLLYKDYRTDFDAATNFLSGLISNLHSGAQIDYANRHSNNKRTRYVSGVDSYDGHGRGRARRGGGRYGQQYGSGRGGHGRGEGRGRGGGRDDRKIVINNVDVVTDPHRNFTTEEWEQRGPARSHVLQLRNTSSGRGSCEVGGCGGGRGSSSGGQQNASSTSTTASNNDTPNSQQQVSEQSTVVSELTERGSQNGRGFGRGAYT